MLMGLDFYFLVIKEMACLQTDIKGNGESSGIWSLDGISKPIASRSQIIRDKINLRNNSH